MNPIGVGFLDLNPEGLFHLERMQLRTDFCCLTGSNSGPPLTKAHGLLGLPAKSSQEIIEDPLVSLLWIGPQADSSLIRSALDAGKHVLIGLPIGTTLSDWQSWIDPGENRSTTKLFVAALHRWDGQFQTVQQLVLTGELGQIIDVRRISRQYVPLELGLQSTAPHTSVAMSFDSLPVQQRELRVQQIKWFEMLDELLQLVPGPVVSVLAQTTGTGRGNESSDRPGRCVSIEFASGCRAWLELNRHSLAPLETGWVLDGTAAGFADGKRFRSGPDYELIDVPVEEVSTDQSAFYNSLAAAIQNSDAEDFPVTNDSIQRVLLLMESIERSIQTGQAAVVDI
ncbi:MAG: oxidoreductase [Planctomycetaceae bacterium]|nr:oxidoreductase [Planctomycetaceae bacterium]